LIVLIDVAGDHETDMEVTKTDVYQEFDRLRQKHGIEEWRAKFVQRKYAFEEQDVQKGESEWMKVVYGFNGELQICAIEMCSC
jgi:DNA polymerase alpha subunit A